MTDAQTQTAGWTPQKVERLLVLLAEGLSATQTGDKLTGEGFGDTTRNAVLGKVHRLGLSRMFNVAPGRPKSPLVPPRPKPRPHQRPVSFGTGLLRAPTLAIATFQPGPEGGVALLDLKFGQCHFPLGTFDEPATKFCGAKTPFGKAYCTKCYAIAYTKPRRNDGTQSKPFTFKPKAAAA